eukprot:351519-Chlamydomonas_euryale.AAC.1
MPLTPCSPQDDPYLQHAPGHGSYVCPPVSADLRLVAHAAERDAHLRAQSVGKASAIIFFKGGERGCEQATRVVCGLPGGLHTTMRSEPDTPGLAIRG